MSRFWSFIRLVPEPVRGFAAILITLFGWSTTFPLTRYALLHLSPQAVSLLRHLPAVICVVVILCLMRRPLPPLKLWPVFVGLGTLGFSFYIIGVSFALNRTEIATVSFIVAQVPIFATVFAVLLHRKLCPRLHLLGILIGVLGTVIILFGKGAEIDIGVLYVLFSSVSVAVFMVLQQTLARQYTPLYATLLFAFGALPVLLIFTPYALAEWPSISPRLWLVLLYIGVMPSFICYILWSWVLHIFPTSRAVAALYAIPFLALVQGLIFFGEWPTVQTLFGGAIALTGAVLVNLPRKKRESAP